MKSNVIHIVLIVAFTQIVVATKLHVQLTFTIDKYATGTSKTKCEVAAKTC